MGFKNKFNFSRRVCPAPERYTVIYVISSDSLFISYSNVTDLINIVINLVSPYRYFSNNEMKVKCQQDAFIFLRLLIITTTYCVRYA